MTTHDPPRIESRPEGAALFERLHAESGAREKLHATRERIEKEQRIRRWYFLGTSAVHLGLTAWRFGGEGFFVAVTSILVMTSVCNLYRSD